MMNNKFSAVPHKWFANNLETEESDFNLFICILNNIVCLYNIVAKNRLKITPFPKRHYILLPDKKINKKQINYI